MNDKNNYPNFCIVTLDSLRFDVAREARTPNFGKYGKWHRVYAHGSNTLPSHIALFQGGQIPYTINGGRYDYRTMRFFRPILNWDRDKQALYVVPESENIVRGLVELGYFTIGIGGVHWFNTEFKTSGSIWQNYFNWFHWQNDFADGNENSFENQLNFIKKNLKYHLDNSKLFFFINIANTHVPFHRGPGGYYGQVAELEYVDGHFQKLVDMMPKPCHFLIFGDHGHCFKNIDGIEGHGFVHSKVMEVPIMDFILE